MFHDTIPNYSLRCQSLIYLKLYKIRRHDFKDVQRTITEYNQKPNQPVSADIVNGNTPSPLSPTSVGSQVSFAWSKGSKGYDVLKCFFLSCTTLQSSGYCSGQTGQTGPIPGSSISSSPSPCLLMPVQVSH